MQGGRQRSWPAMRSAVGWCSNQEEIEREENKMRGIRFLGGSLQGGGWTVLAGGG